MHEPLGPTRGRCAPVYSAIRQDGRPDPGLCRYSGLRSWLGRRSCIEPPGPEIPSNVLSRQKADTRSTCGGTIYRTCYTPSMATKTTLATLAEQLSKMDARMERGFAAVADNISKLATKEQLTGLQTQVNSIEQQLRETKIEVRLGALEEKAFGAPHR